MYDIFAKTFVFLSGKSGGNVAIKKSTRRKPGALVFRNRRLPGVVFDDAHDLDRNRDLLELGSADQSRFEVVEIDFHVRRNDAVALLGSFSGGGGLGGIDGDDLTLFDDAAGAVETFAVNEDVTMVDDLLGSENGGSETGTIDQSIQTHFEAAEKFFVGQTETAFGFGESDTELFFADGVVVTEFLLFEEQFAVGGKFHAAALTMRTSGIRTFDARTFRIAPEALADTTAEFVFCSTCGWHNQSLSLKNLFISGIPGVKPLK